MKRSPICFLLIVFLCTILNAQQQDTVIKAGNLIDPATGSVTQNQFITVRDGKIASISSSAPAGAKVVDLTNHWVMPGLIDAHTHITMNLPVNPPGGSLWESSLVHESTALRALRGVYTGKLLLNAGFTAVRDVGNAGNYADVAVKQGLENGWFVGPTVIPSGKIIGSFGGQFHNIAPEQGKFWEYEYIDAENPDELRKGIRQNIFYGAGVIKLAADNSSFHYMADDIKAAVEEAHRAGVKVAVHVYGGDAADQVILGGADSIEHGWDLTDEQLQRMKERGIYLVGTDFPYEHLVALGQMVPMNAKGRAAGIIDRLRRASRIGVKMAFGADVVVDLPGESRADMAFDYLKVFREAGVSNAEVLKILTVNGADLLGFAKQRGTIAPGMAADIIALPANPLQDTEALRRVNFVMKDGVVVRTPQTNR
jgi:imidazolonepropionase-like amidohydrolase